MHTTCHSAIPYIPALLAAVLLAACASSNSGSDRGPAAKPRPVTSDQAYTGPAVAIDSVTGPNHLIVLSAPSPGWTFTFDQVSPSGRDAYLTIHRPDPGLLYPQVMVEQKMDSTVAAPRPIRVYIRLLDFAEKAGTQPYRLAKETAH
jgi:hypothetical protein